MSRSTTERVSDSGSEPDEPLVLAVLAGDSRALAPLVRRHNAAVFRAARAILRDDAEAEDIAQQTWMSAYAHLEQWDGRARLSTWLVQIASRAALRRMRRRQRATEIARQHAHAMAGKTAMPDEQVDRAELRSRLAAAIGALPETLRAALVLRDVEERTTSECSRVLGVTELVVRVRLHRARRALRAAIEGTLAVAGSARTR